MAINVIDKNSNVWVLQEVLRSRTSDSRLHTRCEFTKCGSVEQILRRNMLCAKKGNFFIWVSYCEFHLKSLNGFFSSCLISALRLCQQTFHWHTYSRFFVSANVCLEKSMHASESQNNTIVDFDKKKDVKANINKWDRNKPIRNKTYKIFLPFSLRNTFIFFDLVSFQYHSLVSKVKKSMIEREYQRNIEIISLLFGIHSYVYHLFYVGVPLSLKKVCNEDC